MNQVIRTSIAAAALAAAATAAAQPTDLGRRGQGDVSLFDRRDFQGYLGSLDGTTRNFGPLGYNDRVASIIVRRGRWEFCTDAGFRGNCRTYGPGEYRSLAPGHDDAYSSARRAGGPDRPAERPGRGPRITLFDSRNFQGRSLQLEDTAPNLEALGFNDRVESVVVHRGQWRLCSDAHGAGRCRTYGPGRYPDLPGDLRSRLSSVRLR